MPFAQSFLGPLGVIVVSLFDVGNAFVCLGGAYGAASIIKDGGGFSAKRLFKTLLTSVPFVCYIIMVTLNLCRVTLPGFVVSFAQTIANANAFVAMFMLGVGFELSSDRKQLGAILKVVIVRYAVAAVLACLFYFLLPVAPEIRKALVILVFSPIGAAVPAFTQELKEDVGLSSAINSMCILISIVIIVTLLTVM
jgi:predicted permease